MTTIVFRPVAFSKREAIESKYEGDLDMSFMFSNSKLTKRVGLLLFVDVVASLLVSMD
jgi:hypothetical protein